MTPANAFLSLTMKRVAVPHPHLPEGENPTRHKTMSAYFAISFYHKLSIDLKLTKDIP